MLKKYYYLLAIPLFCLLFSPTVKAATTTSTSSTDRDGLTVQAFYQTYGNNVPYTDYMEIPETPDYLGVWELTQNVRIQGMREGKYTNGFIIMDFNFTTNATLAEVMIQDSEYTNSIRVFVGSISTNYFRLYIAFDNYNVLGGSFAGLPTINLKFTYRDSIPANFNNMSITCSASIPTCWTKCYDTPQQTGLAGVLTQSIDNSTALATIAGWLYDIKEQDYTYYTTLTTQMANIINAQSTTNSRLLSILNEIDLDFQQVQTILDLFPSYRTQVLQYWQELLQMNTSQSSAAAEIESQYADRESQSSQLINGMGSLVMPSISSGDLDIMGSVDPNQKANFFGLIALITHNQIVTKIMLIIVLGAIVGYILYGKK